MPYRSQAQSRYIHWKATQGEAWAKKFVADAHGQSVGALPQHVKQKIGHPRRGYGTTRKR